MSGAGRGPPKFSPPSGDVKKALQILKDEHLVHRVRKYYSLETAAWPTPAAEAAMETINEETQRRYEKLYKHYRVDITHPLAGAMLAAHLIRDLIPNFELMPLPARGRPRNVLKEHYSLVIAIGALRREDNRRSLVAACRILAKRDGPWKGKRPQELQASYYRYQEQIRDIRAEFEAHLPAQAVAMLEPVLTSFEK